MFSSQSSACSPAAPFPVVSSPHPREAAATARGSAPTAQRRSTLPARRDSLRPPHPRHGRRPRRRRRRERALIARHSLRHQLRRISDASPTHLRRISAAAAENHARGRRAGRRPAAPNVSHVQQSTVPGPGQRARTAHRPAQLHGVHDLSAPGRERPGPLAESIRASKARLG